MKSPFDTDERITFRESVRRFVEREVAPHVDTWDEAGAIPWALHAQVGALGAFGFGVDEAWGGLGFDDAFLRASFAEELARCGAGGVGAALGGRIISVGPIQRFASEAIKAQVLPPVVAGTEGACLAITEPSGGSDVAGLTTRARREDGHYVLDGAKTFITGGMRARWFVVGARTGGPGLSGISLFLVEAGTPGFARTPLERKMGWWCSDQATLHFDACRIPAEHRLGPENGGFLAIMENFNVERLVMIAQCLGMMRALLEDSLSWARERRTFGQRLVEHQVIRHKLVEIRTRIDALAAWLERLCWGVNEGERPVAAICEAKAFATRALEYCASEAMQVLGGAGYLRGNRVERIYREVKVMAIGGGSEEIMRDLAARQLGW